MTQSEQVDPVIDAIEEILDIVIEPVDDDD
jgi:hypothetical protein